MDPITLYWDACMFLHHVHRKNPPTGLLDAIDEIAVSVDAMEVNLCTSAITLIEASRVRLMKDKEKLQRYDRFFDRRNVVPANVDPKVIARAIEINDFYAPLGRTLGTADAIHLATAVLYEATEFHTTDGTGRGEKLIGLKKLTDGGLICGKYKLDILQPKAKNPRLQFSAGEAE